jgi:hypothetical protein
MLRLQRSARQQTGEGHYVPVLARKPGALPGGAPFKHWVLPGALERVRRRLSGSAEGDRQMVAVLAAALSDGLEAVDAACALALRQGVCSAKPALGPAKPDPWVILSLLARHRPTAAPGRIEVPGVLALTVVPDADCARYDRLRGAAESAHGTP